MAGVPVQNDSGTKLDVKLSRTTSEVGYAAPACESDAGTITGSALSITPEATDDFRQRVGADTLLDHEVFNYAAQNTGKHVYHNATMTITWGGAGGFLRTNGSSITTITTGVGFSTQRVYPVGGSSPLYCEMKAGFSAAPTTNTTIDFGLFIRSTSNPYAPTDGVYFRANSTGVFGVANYNGTEVTTGVLLASPTINQIYKFAITTSPGVTRFWINDVLYGSINQGNSNYAPQVNGSVPFSVRHAIIAGAAGATIQFLLGTYFVSAGDLNDQLTAADARALQGQAYQGLSGGTMGSLANFANSTNPTSAAGSNTATLVTGLGGQAACNATAGAATDFVFLSYQNPAGTLGQTARTLVIDGVWLSTVNMGAAVATTPTTVVWSIAYGHTAVSMATAEAATMKAPRRIPLGAQSAPVAAAIGAPYTPDRIFVTLAPFAVNPGEFVALVGKIIVGTATASQSVWTFAGFSHKFV